MAQPEQIAFARLIALLESGAQLVDVLPAREFAADHLPGALNVPLKQLDAATAATLDRGKAVVVYCHDHL
jgi:rhodanese-related sulfurtransferase